MIQAQIEQLINRLKAEKESELRNVQQKVMEDKILPFNANIDSLRDKAIAQKTEELNNAINALREKYNAERQEIIEASERNKAANLEAVIAAETSIINSKYDSTISDLQSCMGRVKE